MIKMFVYYDKEDQTSDSLVRHVVKQILSYIHVYDAQRVGKCRSNLLRLDRLPTGLREEVG